MDIKRFKSKLERYLKGKANETESAIVEAWYKSYQTEEAREINNVDKAAIKQAIRYNINSAVKPPVKLWGKSFYRMAAGLLLFSGAALFYFWDHQKNITTITYTTLQTKAGEVKQIVLPDSSLMWVNSLSRVRIPSAFNGTIRNILLDEGEAFFEVKHNKLKPFRITTSSLQVQVLGTSFNINAYKNLKHTRVAVATGKVAVSSEGKRLTFLIPGQELVFDNQAKTYKQNIIDVNQGRNWKNGDTYLKQASFNELSVVVKNLYGINLKPANQAVEKFQFTLRLQRGLQAAEALKVIGVIHNSHFRKEGNNVILY
ncbi:FecR family protein [Mucilaginibacter litoreus]|uniref:FecR family protein n=1 Tax=Mucilaginibacter litoreus TaxID=1048221 RepID=A0ABW3AX11_9SPHI